ncbi:MAG TPA: MATE family efflux transporter [Nocardioidaceae bacterium]|nr:MATE family efflux transporter [Nocardioidaceae bacterium]
MNVAAASRRAQDREIARLAIPAFAALVSEPLFLLADAAIIGHLGTAQLAALGIAGIVIQTLMGIFIFLAYGTTSQVARLVGAGQRERALAVGIDGVWLALLLGTALAVLAIAAAEPLVDVFTQDADVRGYALTYLRIAALGLPGLLTILAATGVVRGFQDTRTPLAVTVVANLLNIVLNLALVYGLGWGIAGSAIGTVLAQSAGAAALCAVVVRAAHRHGAALRPHRDGIRAAWREGVPLMVRTLTLRAALVLATFVAASISTVAVAAHQVAFTLWSFLAFALDAIAIAGQAITGRLLGAGDAAGARAATRRMVWWGAVAGGVLGVALLVSRDLLVPLFTDDPAVQALLASVLIIVAVHQPVAGVVFVLDGVLIGAGDGRYLAWAGVGTLAVFAPLALAVMWADAGLPWLWWALVALMVARLITLVQRARGERWLVLGASTR